MATGRCPEGRCKRTSDVITQIRSLSHTELEGDLNFHYFLPEEDCRFWGELEKFAAMSAYICSLDLEVGEWSREASAEIYRDAFDGRAVITADQYSPIPTAAYYHPTDTVLLHLIGDETTLRREADELVSEFKSFVEHYKQVMADQFSTY